MYNTTEHVTMKFIMIATVFVCRVTLCNIVPHLTTYENITKHESRCRHDVQQCYNTCTHRGNMLQCMDIQYKRSSTCVHEYTTVRNDK